MIENKAKEDIFKLVEEADKLKPVKKSPQQLEFYEIPKKYKSVFEIGFNRLNLSLLEHESVWNFIHKTNNLIDLQDFLLTYDHHKLISKAKKNVKDKDSKKIVDYFEKFYKERERKYREIFKGNLEDNDIIFLETEEYIKEYKHPNKHATTVKNLDFHKFPKLFELLTSNLKSHMLNFLDIQSVGKFSMINKQIYHFVAKKYNYEKLAKFYCLMIFKGHNLYKHDEKKLKLYKNYFDMFKKRLIKHNIGQEFFTLEFITPK
jgi:hypothetical protein